jgi:hypothetical protein
MDHMANKIEFSFEVDIANTLNLPLADTDKSNRYHSSYAVWQLSRMGTYNTAGEIPLAIRLDHYDEVVERYPDRERLIGLIDAGKLETDDQEAFESFLLRFALKRIKSCQPETLSALLITSAKHFQDSPVNLMEWSNSAELHTSLLTGLKRIDGLSDMDGKAPDLDSIVRHVLENTTIEYHRRRQGRYGDDTLFGVELNAVKVLQDAGITGTDLAHALKALINQISPAHDKKQKTAVPVFTRDDAFFLIRDYKRRAYLTMPSVRVIDERFLKEENFRDLCLPRVPSWNQVLHSKKFPAVSRNDLDSAVKWARRAAITSGRGLLPLFLFTGPSGTGKSILLKQAAWKLYQQGFVVAEILNLEEAAEEAEQLATAAVASDAPLVLIWDDSLGLCQNPVPWFKEIAAAQISGAPIAVLSCASSKEVYPKFLTRTIVEEYTVQTLSPEELQPLNPGKNNQTDPVADPAGEPENEPVSLDVWLQTVLGSTLQEMGKRLIESLDSPPPKLETAIQVTTAMGMLGLSTPGLLLEKLLTRKTKLSIEKQMAKQDEPILRQRSHDDHSSLDLWDVGHPLLARSIWFNLAVGEDKISPLFESIIKTCAKEPDLQPWIVRILHAVSTGPNLPFTPKDFITGIIQSTLETSPDILTTPVISRLFPLVKDQDLEKLHALLVKTMADRIRAGSVDAFTALSPLLRNQLGGLSDGESLAAVNAAKPSLDRLGFRFLLKYLGDHMPGDLGNKAVEDARTAAARDPDNGYAVDAYLQLAVQRGSEEQISRSIQETQNWLDMNPEDRVVWRSFVELILKKGSQDMKNDLMEPLTGWLESHFDEGPLRKHYLDLAVTSNDPQILDRALSQTGDWIEKIGNNRSVRRQYFRLTEQRNDKAIMQRACDVAQTWLSSHPDDRETIQSMLYLSARAKLPEYIGLALDKTHAWLSAHPIETSLLKRYLIQVDRDGKSRQITDAVVLVDAYLDEHPEDHDIRKLILGLAAKKLDKKIQTRIYNKNCKWLDEQTETHATFEYLIGRLGVRAGIARRAIPLLERAVVRDDSPLQNHARLWLGSAYRISGEYLDAKKAWNRVLITDDENMKSKAQKNLESLDSFLNKKFPDGYPPKKEPRSHPPKKQKPRDTAESRKMVRTPGKPQHSPEPKRASISKQLPRRGKPPGGRKRADKFVKPETSRQGATLGDLLKLQGLDLLGELSKSDKEKKSSSKKRSS